MELKDKLVLLTEKTEYLEEAKKIADHLGIDVIDKRDSLPSGLLFLVRDDKGLSLSDGDMVISADFTGMLPRLKQSNLQNEMLLKAAKLKGVNRGLKIIDATAGFGEDSLLLAAAGNYIELYEYDPVIAALLADGLRRASEIPELMHIVDRMTLIEADSIRAMNSMRDDDSIDIIFLDPMFPERQKSASVKKKFQILQRLESPCSEEEELLAAAINARPRKLVIKRPVKGPYLGGRKPDYAYSGKAIRYDCFAFAQA